MESRATAEQKERQQTQGANKKILMQKSGLRGNNMFQGLTTDANGMLMIIKKPNVEERLDTQQDIHIYGARTSRPEVN